jgi:hypothetical protein
MAVASLWTPEAPKIPRAWDSPSVRAGVQAAAWLCGVVRHPEIGRLRHYVDPISYVVRQGLVKPGWNRTAEAPLLDDSSLKEKVACIARPLGRVARGLRGMPVVDQVAGIHGITQDYLGDEPFGPYGQSADVLPDYVALSAMLDDLAVNRSQCCQPLAAWISEHS